MFRVPISSSYDAIPQLVVEYGLCSYVINSSPFLKVLLFLLSFINLILVVVHDCVGSFAQQFCVKIVFLNLYHFFGARFTFHSLVYCPQPYLLSLRNPENYHTSIDLRVFIYVIKRSMGP
jgi:hypothetical protein